MDFIFDTNSSGAIVSWNFGAAVFLMGSPPSQNGLQTVYQPGNVDDSAYWYNPAGILGMASVPYDPGVWVETIVPEPSVGLLFVSFAALVLASGRFKPSPPRPHSGSEG